MTTPVADHIVKARQSLKEARAVLTIDLAEAAGRAAYLAAYHAAQAFVLDRTGKTAKTHSGVRSEFARLAKDESRLDRSYSSFLARAYNLKSALIMPSGLTSVSVRTMRERLFSGPSFSSMAWRRC
jgi:uncharacterized protein (UPF0332 family)